MHNEKIKKLSLCYVKFKLVERLQDTRMYVNISYIEIVFYLKPVVNFIQPKFKTYILIISNLQT